MEGKRYFFESYPTAEELSKEKVGTDQQWSSEERLYELAYS